MKKLVVAASVAALVCTSLPSHAAAQGPVAAAKQTDRKQGLMLRLGLGVDHCTDDWCDDIDPSASVRLVVGYRFLKYVAVGVHTAFLFGDPDNGVADFAWNVFLGVEGRGIFPYKRFDFWVSVALGWNRTMLNGDQFVPGQGVVDGRYWMNAFALGFGFGADFFITKNIAVGLTFYLYKPWPDKGCYDTDVSDRDCIDLSNDVEDDIGLIWSINAMFTYYLPL